MATAEAETSLEERGPPGGLVYDGFISYSHAADDLLAPRLQAGLQRFAKPWWKRRALRIFRDEASLSANPHLWSSITDALDESAWFVLLLSPEAAESPWVNNEVEYWLEHKDPDQIIPVLTDGEFGWVSGDITGDAVPPGLQGAFSDEPRWVDLRFARSDVQLDLKNPTFSAAVADIASPIRGVPKDELESEEVRQHRRTRRTAVGAAIALLVLAVAAAVFGVVARNNARDAESSRLATAAIDVLDADPELALLLAVSSAEKAGAPGFETRRALHAAIDRSKALASLAHHAPNAWTITATIAPDATKVAVSGNARASVGVYGFDGDGLELMWEMDIPNEWQVHPVFTADGRYVVASVAWPEWDASVSASVFDTPSDPSIAGLYVFDAETGELVARPEGPDVCGLPLYDIARFPRLPDEIVGFCRFQPYWWVVDTSTWHVTEVNEVEGMVFFALGVLDGSLAQIVSGVPPMLTVTVLDRVTGEAFVPEVDFSLTKYDEWSLSSTGKFAAFGANLIDPRTGELVLRFEAEQPLDDCGFIPAFDESDTLAFVGCEDGTTHVFDTATGEHLHRLEGHVGWSAYGSFTADGSILATGAGDGMVRLWRLDHRAEVRSIDLGPGYHADAGIDVIGDIGVGVVYPDENTSLFHFFFSSMTRPAIGDLVVFDVPSGRTIHRISGVGGKVARLSPDGAQVVVQSATKDGVSDLAVYDVETGSLVSTLPGLCPWQPFAGDQSHCGELIAADATDLAWSPDGSHIAMSGGWSQRLLVWNTATGDLEFVAEPLGTPGFAFSAVTYSVDGETLAVSSKTGMWVYDTQTWELLTPLIPHTGRPSWVMQFASDGAELVTAQAHSGEIRIYNTATWDHRTYRGGVGQTRDMAISSDEAMVAIAANDGNIHILHLESGDLLDLISLGNRDLTNIEFIDSDRRLLISSSTGPVEIVTLDRAELVDIARTRISRTFSANECAFYELEPCPALEDLRGS